MSDDAKIASLRETILKLEAASADGFEGLLAVVLTEVTGTIFNIAKSGTQGGKDGQSLMDSGAVKFEAKLYRGVVPPNEVITKIAQISADKDSRTELFIVGNSGTLSTQTTETIQKIGLSARIATLLLDWSSAGLSPLATLLAMSKDLAADFISKQTGVPISEVLDGLDAVRAHQQYAAREAELLTALNEPNIAPAYALKYNFEWLSEVFGSSRKARIKLGQPLAPGEATNSNIRARTTLVQKLSSFLFQKPNTNITAILGGDGNGKSWLFGQAWLGRAFKVLTVIVIPDDLKSQPYSEQEMIDLLIKKLIEQTGDSYSDRAHERWLAHFARWKNIANPEVPRLVVFLDGINQRERLTWAKIINGMNDVLAARGCKLCISCRKPQFEGIRDQIIDTIETIEVPEWTEPELKELLAAHRVDIGNLAASVIKSLRNPRIFGLAVQLVQDGKARFDELSVTRILYEHIRIGGAAGEISAPDFKRGIKDHADEIVRRIKTKSAEELRVFDRKSGQNDSSIGDKLAVISAGHVFEEIEGEPTLYSLREESVPLALGLSVLGTAKEAGRTGKDIPSKVAELIDPIAALDITAEVLISAIISGVLEGGVPAPVISALVTAYIGLQNLDEGRRGEFASLMRAAPEAFVLALESATLSEGITSNLDLLSETIDEARMEPAVWAVIEKSIRRWLRMYSLSPERMVHGGIGRAKAEVDKERELSVKRIADNLAALNHQEKALLSAMICEERGDYAKLVIAGLKILAGKPLASFAEELRACSLASSLNGGYHDGHNTFMDLLQFNTADWKASREALLTVAAPLREGNVSRSGKWTLVALLRATANSADAKEADLIAEELTKDREKFAGWRRIENWCTTDPCDPSSQEPENIEKTAVEYAALDVSKAKAHRDQAFDDHFFDEARVGLARFRPEVAIESIRRFAANALGREDENFRFAVFMLENHTAALDDAGAKAYVPKAAEVAAMSLGTVDKHGEILIAAEYALQIAFPHMTGDEQLEALLAHPKSTFMALDLCRLFEPADQALYEKHLELAFAAKDDISLFRLMCFAEYSGTPITDRAKEIVGELVSSTDNLVRLCALGVVSELNDENLLGKVVASGWGAAKLDATKARFEISIGSQVLIQATERGLLPFEGCLDRISIESYARFVELLGKDAAAVIANRVSIALQKAAGHEVALNLPIIERGLDNGSRPALFILHDRPEPKETVRDTFARLSESNDAFHERQKRNQDALDKFQSELTKSGAELILYHLDGRLFEKLFETAPEVVKRWVATFMSMDRRALSRIRNVGLSVAQAVARSDQKLAAELFEKLNSVSSHVNVVYGIAEVSLDTISIWQAADGSEVRDLQFRRLDRAGTDFWISNEVLAAILADKDHVLEAYVEDRITREEPAHIARALMVAGFSEGNAWAGQVLDAYKEADGFLGMAYTAAKYAMDRHIWSKHWAEGMRDAKTPTELWRNAIILEKIVDGRFDGAVMDAAPKDAPVKRYGVTFNDLIKKRIKSWKDKRDKKLFGMDKPDSRFVT